MKMKIHGSLGVPVLLLPVLFLGVQTVLGSTLDSSVDALLVTPFRPAKTVLWS